MQRCPVCHATYPGNVLFCPVDGTGLRAERPAPAKRSGRRRMTVVALSLGLAVATGVLALAVVALWDRPLVKQQSAAVVSQTPRPSPPSRAALPVLVDRDSTTAETEPEDNPPEDQAAPSRSDAEATELRTPPEQPADAGEAAPAAAPVEASPPKAVEELLTAPSTTCDLVQLRSRQLALVSECPSVRDPEERTACVRQLREVHQKIESCAG